MLVKIKYYCASIFFVLCFLMGDFHVINEAEAFHEGSSSLIRDEEPGFIIPKTDSGFLGDMVLVKGGCFQMGDTFNEGSKSEKPAHEVCLDDFFMGEHEVTQSEWEKIMENNPSYFKKGNNYPVEMVDWDEVRRFIKKLRNKTGIKYRLPTEAEWEYAAREGGKKVRFGTGKNIVDPDEANFNASPNFVNSYSKMGVFRASTTPVKSFSANALGLYDMAGNVWEWCSDWYGDDYYANSPRNNPKGAFMGSARITRGGGWSNLPGYLRASYRGSLTFYYRRNVLGFRLALFANDL